MYECKGRKEINEMDGVEVTGGTEAKKQRWTAMKNGSPITELH